MKTNWFNPIIVVILISFSLVFIGCDVEYSPRPRGYFRIDLPQKHYTTFSSDCPFTFAYPTYSIVHSFDSTHPCWYNIDFPLFKAKIHLSYKQVNNQLPNLLEESRSFAYKHISKADAITEELLLFPEKKVYGTYYEIKGNTASSIQFYLTDSTDNFMRGALYFSLSPNIDSIAPVLDFIEIDIKKFIDSFEWQ